MPFVRLATSVKLDNEAVQRARQIIGETISIIPGKSFEVTMIEIVPEAIISRGDPAKPAAFIEIRLFGPAPISAKKKFVAVFCELLEKDLGIPQDCVSLNILELDSWGGRGEFNTFY